ncbi:MAG: integrase/recombinase XerC [Janthinobacterium sp.]|jgi:integrase/recombinase XerC
MSPADQQGIVDYLRHLTSQRKLSPHTLEAYRRDLAQLATLCSGRPWAAVDHLEIRRHAAGLHAHGLAARSIARKLSAWRGFFDWLARQSGLAVNPVDAVRAPKRAAALPKALSVDDAVHLVASVAHAHGPLPAADLCNRAMFELLYSSGLRVSELASLDVEYKKAEGNLSASLGWLDIGSREVLVTGKGSKMRKVPVGAAAIAAIAAWLAVRPTPLDGSAALFLSQRGSRISPRVLQLRLKAHAQAVGTPTSVHPHVLRHSFASHILQSSGDLRAVQEMLGHASIRSTQVYTALDFQHLAQVYDQAHPRAKIKPQPK